MVFNKAKGDPIKYEVYPIIIEIRMVDGGVPGKFSFGNFGSSRWATLELWISIEPSWWDETKGANYFWSFWNRGGIFH